MVTTATLLGLTIHERWDIALWFIFFLGQCLFILKRAGSAVRSKTNPIKSRTQFLSANWDIFLIRTIIEVFFPYYPVRHMSIGTIAGIVHFTLPSWIPSDSKMPAMGFFLLGYFADSGFDWFSQNQRVPLWLRQAIKEQVPDIQTVLEVKQTTTMTQTTQVTETPKP